MDVNMSILVIISCICILFVIGRIFIVPIKWIAKLILNSILGGVLIWIINVIGGIWSFHIGLNLWTSILVGILGVPGALLLILIRLMVRNLKLKIYWVNFKIKKARGNNLMLPLVVPLACEDGAAVRLRFIKYSLRMMDYQSTRLKWMISSIFWRASLEIRISYLPWKTFRNFRSNSPSYL